MTYPAFMDEAAYQAAIKALTECHPEDLTNIISRVIHDRTDVTSPSGQEYSTGNYLLPGCPGESDCTDTGHDEGHLPVNTRRVTLAFTAFDEVVVQSSIASCVCHVCKGAFTRAQVTLDHAASRYGATPWICCSCRTNRDEAN